MVLEIDTQHKDGDPRKTAFARGLMQHHKDAVKIWQNFGLMAKITLVDEATVRKDAEWGHSVRKTKQGWERRKHFAPEHMVTVIAGTQALGQLLEDLGYLSDSQVFEIEEAAAVHDAGKELEFNLVNEVLNDKIADNKGLRAQEAYDLAGDTNAERLTSEGISEELIKLQKMVGHASCPEIEKLIDSFNSQAGLDQQRTMEMAVLHYIDDIVTNPNIIDPSITIGGHGERLNALDRRCIQNANNIKYRDYDLSWQQDKRNSTGETAFAMQRRVGHKVEKFLADLLGVEDPLTLPVLIDAKIRDNIQRNWDSMHTNSSILRL